MIFKRRISAKTFLKESKGEMLLDFPLVSLLMLVNTKKAEKPSIFNSYKINLTKSQFLRPLRIIDSKLTNNNTVSTFTDTNEINLFLKRKESTKTNTI